MRRGLEDSEGNVTLAAGFMHVSFLEAGAGAWLQQFSLLDAKSVHYLTVRRTGGLGDRDRFAPHRVTLQPTRGREMARAGSSASRHGCVEDIGPDSPELCRRHDGMASEGE